MESFFIFLISSFATYRLAIMFAKEIGPCRMFERFRALPKADGCLSKGISCILCNSVWWAGLISLWLVVIGIIPWHMSLIYWLATSGASILINEKGYKFD